MDEFRRKASLLVKEWQEWLVWMPLALLLVVVMGAAMQWVFPHSGVDAPTGFHATLIAVLEGIPVVGMAWLCKRLYTHDLDDIEERVLYLQATSTKPGALPSVALKYLILDRLEWAGWLTLWFFLLR